MQYFCFVFFRGHSLLDLLDPRSRLVGIKLKHPMKRYLRYDRKTKILPLVKPTFLVGLEGERGARVEREVRKEQKAKLKVTWMKPDDTLFIDINPAQNNSRKSKTIEEQRKHQSVSIGYSKKCKYCKRQGFVQPQLIWQRERHIHISPQIKMY